MISGISSSSSLMTAIMAKLSQSQQTHPGKSLFAKADADGSGTVSVDELSALAPKDGKGPTATEIVTAADTDGDSELTEDELLAYFSQMSTGGLSGANNSQLASSRTENGGGMMSIADADGDGVLSYDEFASMKPSDVSDEQSQALFDSADTDGDGSLSESEVSAFEANRPQGGPQGGMAMGGPMGPPPPSDSDEDDTNVSSLLSKLIDSLSSTNETSETDETTTASTTDTTDTTTSDEEKIFNFFDTDGDGTVSESELNTGVAALKTAMANYLLSLQESRAAA